MTSTDELRRLLDGRGATVDETIYPDRRFAFRVVGSDAEIILDNSYGKTGRFAVFNLTPEQAVEATLGRGTCRIEKRHMDWRYTGCGEIVGTDDPTSELFVDGNAVELWHYCPNCGRSIKA